MPTTLTKVILLFSSFSPLLLVFALLDSFGQGWPTALCATVAIASWVSLFLLYRVAIKISPIPLKIDIARQKDSDLIAYVATYFVPFLTVPGDSWRKAAALGIFICLIGTYYIRGEMYHWNPLLAIFKKRVIEAQTPDGEVVTIISRRSTIEASSEVSVHPITPRIYWEKVKA